IEIGDVALIFEADRLELLPTTATAPPAQDAARPMGPGVAVQGAPRPMVPPRATGYRRSSSSSSTVMAAVFAAVILVGAVFAVRFINRGEDPAITQARGRLARAEALKMEALGHDPAEPEWRQRRFEEAVRELEAIPPDQRIFVEDTQSKISDRIRELQRAADSEREMAATQKPRGQLEELKTYAAAHPEDLDGIQKRVDAFRRKFADPDLLKEADAVLEAALAAKSGAQEEEFKKVSRAVDEMMRSSEFSGACKALDEYASKYPTARSADTARSRKREAVAEGQTWFQARLAEGDEFIKAKKWRAARAVYEKVTKAFGEDPNFFELTLRARSELDRIKRLEAEE
ncbi:MAG: hypothetical protein HYY93_09665, partial [Planctomycetes bacterium]|nr:hypothetical protein [Planctomycetota bacterium]